MVIVKKKIWPDFFELVKRGKKRFELRVADFDVKEGDTLVLQEWDPKTKQYTGCSIKKKVGYTLKVKLDDFGQRDLIEKRGLYVVSLTSI